MVAGYIISGNPLAKQVRPLLKYKTMRILHIIYDDVKNPWCGGGGALRAKMVNKYLAKKNKITVFTGRFPGAKNETINNVEYIRIGINNSYLLSRISFTLLIPFYLSSFKGDIIINDCSFFAPCFADWYTKRPVVNIVHHLMGRHAFRIYGIIGSIPFLSELLMIKMAENIITPSKEIKEEIEKRYPKKVVVSIPNGISEDLLYLEPEENGFILFLGRIDIYMKGLDTLVESFSRISRDDIVLKIAGSGKKGDEKILEDLIKKYGVEKRVEIMGRVNEETKRELLRACLFLAMPSRFEGWGIAAVEANAAAKPVLGTYIQGFSEAVVNNKTALLVKPDDSKALATAMISLIENVKLRNNLAREGRKWARKFLWRSIAEEQFNLYRALLKRP